MGWWEQSEEGESFATSESGEGLLWGDGPADILGEAFDQIKVEFIRDWGRLPTRVEVRAGLEFTLRRVLEELPDNVFEAKPATEDEVRLAGFAVEGHSWPEGLRAAVERLAP